MKKTFSYIGCTALAAVITFALAACPTPLEPPETYTITWKNHDGAVLETDNDVAGGVTPEYNGATPVKAEDGQNTYTFNGWSPAPVAVTADAAYTAQFTAASKNSGTFTITWKNHDGAVLETDSNVASGATPEYNSDEPVKAEDDNYTYTFNGWSPAPGAVSADATYTAAFTAVPKGQQTITITWKNHDGTTLETDIVRGGGMPDYNGATPVKAEDADNYYNFNGWSPALTAVSGNAVYTATFAAIPKGSETFTIIWKNHDGATLETDIVIAGNTPEYNGSTPTKPADDNNAYTWSGWSPALTTVNADQTYTAQFTAVAKRTVTASANNPSYGTVQGGGDYADGETVTLTAIPNTGYKFDNWTENSVIVSTDAVYTFKAAKDVSPIANFSEIVPTYTITWKNHDATILETDNVKAGNMPEFNGPTPTKPGDNGNTYTFNGWAPAPVAASANATYTAQFTAIPIEYTVEVSVNDPAFGTVSGGGEYAHGTTVTLTATPYPGYQFDNWTENGAPVSTDEVYNFTTAKNISFVANFSIAKFTVSVSVNDPARGMISFRGGEYEEGKELWVSSTPKSGYKFVNWTENGAEVGTEDQYNFTVTRDISLVANFSVISSSDISYTITAAVNNSAWGTVTDMTGAVTSGGVYAEGAIFYLNAKPNAGYVFKEWYLNGYPQGTDFSAYFSWIAVTDYSWVAHFEPDPALDPDGDGIPGTPGPGDYTVIVNGGTGSGYYQLNETITIKTNDPAFIEWSIREPDDDQISTPEYSFTLQEYIDAGLELTTTTIRINSIGSDRNMGFALLETDTLNWSGDHSFQIIYTDATTDTGYPYKRVTSTIDNAYDVEAVFFVADIDSWADSDQDVDTGHWDRTDYIKAGVSIGGVNTLYTDPEITYIPDSHYTMRTTKPYIVVFWLYDYYHYTIGSVIKARVEKVYTKAEIAAAGGEISYTTLSGHCEIILHSSN